LVESALLFFSLELLLELFSDGLVALSVDGLFVVVDDLVFGEALIAGAGVGVALVFVAGVIVAAAVAFAAGVVVAPVTGAALALVVGALLVVVPVVVAPVVVVPVVVAETPNVGAVTP